MARSSRTQDIFSFSLRELEVRTVTDLTPSMRRVVFGGEQFFGHTLDAVTMPPFTSNGFDDDVRIIFPDPVTGERPYPTPMGDGRLNWNAHLNSLFRTYTVRAVDETAGTVTIDFAHHPLGLAEGWVTAAQPGDKVWMVDPKNCASLPTHREWLLLAGDETALPAIARCLEELPQGFPVTVFIEVPTRADRVPLATTADIDLHWVIRQEDGDFVKELSSWEFPGQQKTRGFVWAAGEATRLKPLRTLFKTRGIPAEDCQITGYWRATQASVDKEGRVIGGGYDALFKLQELTDLTPALTIRAAVSLGIFPLIDAGVTSVAALAQRTGVEAARLLRLLRYLGSIDIVTLERLGAADTDDAAADTDGAGGDCCGQVEVRLTALGAELAHPDSHIAGALTGPFDLARTSLLGLESVLRTGQPALLGENREPWEEIVSSNTMDAVAESNAQWIAPAVAASEDFAGQHVVVLGPGRKTYAQEIQRRHPGATVKTADPLDFVGTGRCIIGDIAVLLDPFSWKCSREQFVESLSGLDVEELQVVTRLVALQGGENRDYEADLLRMCLTSTTIPSYEDVCRTLKTSGFVCMSQRSVGWSGEQVIVARRHPEL